MTDKKNFPADAHQNLIEAIQELINTSSPEEALDVIHRNPELMNDETETILCKIMANLRSKGDNEVASLIQNKWKDLQSSLFHSRFVKAQNTEQLYHHGEGIQFLDKAIQIWEQILNHPEFPGLSEDFHVRVFNDSACTYIHKYWYAGEIEDLNKAIFLWDQAVKKSPENSEDLPIFLNNFAEGVANRYKQTGDISDIEQGIEACKFAVSMVSEDSSVYPVLLNTFGIGLSLLYDYNGNPETLDSCINFLNKAVLLAPDSSDTLLTGLNELGNGFIDRYNHTGNIRDLEDGLKFLRKGVKTAPDNSPYLSVLLTSLGIGLKRYYFNTGKFEHIEEAIISFQKALELTSENSPNMPVYLNSFANSLIDRYVFTGNFKDIEDAVTACRQAILMTPETSPYLPTRLDNLGTALIYCYNRSGNVKHLEDGIKTYRKSVFLTPDSSSALPIRLNNLGNSLINRYSLMRNIADLEEGIKLYRKAILLTPETSADLPTRLNNLGEALRRHYYFNGNIKDIEEGIEVCQQAVSAASKNSPYFPMYLNNLGLGFMSRYNRVENIQDIEQAISTFQDAILLIPDNSNYLPSLLNNLGNGLRYRYSYSGNSADLEENIKSYHKSAKQGLGIALEEGLRSSANWLKWAFDRQSWQEIEQACFYSYQVIEQLLKNQLLRENKEIWLKETQGISEQVAYALAKLNKLRDASVAIERGLARLLTEALAIDRANLEQLKETEHAKLIDDYQQAVDQWYVLTQKNNLSEQEFSTLQSAREKLDKIIETIRTIEGYESLLASPEFGDIQTAAQENHLVYILTTEAGGLALIVRETVSPVWLPELTSETLSERLEAYTKMEWQAALENITQWLWDAVMKPITEALPQVKKITLIPSGLLTLLPLHAAWDKDTNRYVSDILTISYSPNARSLNEARALADRVKADKMLAVDNPGSDLPNAEYEVRAVVSNFEHQIFRRKKAICREVLKALPDYSVLHFACHGKADFENPLFNSLIMADGEITLQDFLELRLKGVRLATLSACSTSVPGTELPDEIVSLPSGLLQAGVAGIIASLWMVDDLSTMMLMTRFYEFWQKGSDPAEALKQAQLWIRKAKGNELAAICELLYVKSGRKSPDLYIAIRYFKNNKNSVLFEHPYYWAGFEYVGI